MVKKKVSKTSHRRVRFNKGVSDNSSNKNKKTKRLSGRLVKNSKIENSKIIKQTNPIANDNKLLISNTDSGSEQLADIKDTNTVNNQLISKENATLSDVKVPVLNENVSQTINDSKALKIFGISLVLVIILFWIIVLVLSINIYTGPKLVERNVTLLSYAPIDMSFERLLKINDTSYTESLSLLGYLYEENITKNISNNIYENKSTDTNKYLVDINNNKILLMLDDTQIEDYDKLFSENKDIFSVYNVTGKYFYNTSTYIIDVDTIIKMNNIIYNGKKLLKEVRIQKMENISEGEETPGISFNIERGIVKVFSIMS
ncbi:MAG: hypothetical protein ACP5N1_05760 [Candidatus Woesearchaeota archaeon]